jgi:hypothetical protein
MLFVSLQVSEGHVSEDKVTYVMTAPKDAFNVEEAIHILKTETLYLKRDLKKIDSLAFNIMYNTVEDSLVDKFVLTKEELLICVEALSITEGSIVTKKGLKPYKSSLFVLSNNPFGIKGKGHVALTTEYINGERKRLYLPFRKFESFGHAVNFLLDLLIRNYNSEHAKTREEFFWSLKEGGYFTASARYVYTLMGVSNDIKAIHEES